jgi:hypothetical protein
MQLSRKIQPPPLESLPSTRRLLLLTAIALAGIVTVVVAIVLPAERAIDPTGFGRVTGLTLMGQVKLDLAMEAADHAYADEMARTADSVTLITTTSDTAGAGRTGQTEIRIAPRDSSDGLLLMKRGAAVSYTWSTDGSAVSALMFGDSLNAPPRARHRYRKDGVQTSGSGELVAAFDGFHGWRWYNPGNTLVTVRLRTTGRYLGGRQVSSGE